MTNTVKEHSDLKSPHGLGSVFEVMLSASVVLPVSTCFKGAITRHEGMTPRVAASVAVGAQALADFSLQMQAVTLTFMALLGAGLAQSESSRLALNDQEEPPPSLMTRRTGLARRVQFYERSKRPVCEKSKRPAAVYTVSKDADAD
jgi:hypothetical protein